jgi:hypothetical protein
MLGERRHPHFSSRSVSDGDQPTRDVVRIVAMWEQYKADNTVLDISLDLAETMK